MRAYLMPLPNGEPIELTKPITLIGRSPVCDLQLDARSVSRLHCCISIGPEALYIRDLDSTNGVKINGDRVAEGALDSGVEVAIGKVLFRMVRKVDDADQSATPSGSDAEAVGKAGVPKAQGVFEDEDSVLVLPDDLRPAPTSSGADIPNPNLGG